MNNKENIDFFNHLNSNKPTDTSRLLPLQGAYNVRDLGGYPTAQGTQVKWRKVLRSGDLHQLTDTDLNYLSKISVKTYIDFRDTDEIKVAPDKTPESLEHEFALPISAGNILDIGKTAAEQAPTILVDMNKMFVRNCQDIYKEFFQIIQNDPYAPVLFHCSAGKDRTGFGAALLLSALGVDRALVMHDYLLSNRYLAGKYDAAVAANPILAPLVAAESVYLQAALDVIDTEFGGMDEYLTQNLDVDLNKIRTIYTE